MSAFIRLTLLRRIARHLLNDLLRVALEGGLLRLLPIDLGLARSKNQLKIHNLIVAGCVQNGFLRPSSERRELSADNVTAVLRNIQLPRTGNVSGRGVALAGECVLRGDGDARQRDSAAFDHAMEFAAGDGFGRGRGCLDSSGLGWRSLRRRSLRPCIHGQLVAGVGQLLVRRLHLRGGRRAFQQSSWPRPAPLRRRSCRQPAPFRRSP